MNFLRALFWIVLTFVVVVFSLHNWSNVTVQLFGGLAADVKLPLLMLASFLLGFAPLYVWHRAYRWRIDRRTLPRTSRRASMRRRSRWRQVCSW